MHPINEFSPESKCTDWVEVSVCGSIFRLNNTKIIPISNTQVCVIFTSTYKRGINFWFYDFKKKIKFYKGSPLLIFFMPNFKKKKFLPKLQQID
jgi:hypothetical protein